MEEAATSWDVWDVYCGAGGYSAGALAAFEAAGVRGVSFTGIDSDKVPLEMWKRNVSAHPAAGSVCTRAITIGVDPIDWPDENGRLIMHWSPSCQPFSRARAAPAAQTAVEQGLTQIRMILELVLAKGYRRWSIEEVAHPRIVALAEEYCRRHPLRVASDVFDAQSYGCPSERRRLIIGSAPLLAEMKARTATTYTSPGEALRAAGLEPASSFYRNGNVTCTPRSVARPAFTVTAGHPLVFCNADRSLVRCMTPRESAVLVGLPSRWELPTKKAAAQRAAGNVISPFLSKVIVECAIELPQADHPPLAQQNNDEHVSRTVFEAEIARLHEKLDALREKV